MGLKGLGLIGSWARLLLNCVGMFWKQATPSGVGNAGREKNIEARRGFRVRVGNTQG